MQQELLLWDRRSPANPGRGELSIGLEKQWGSIEHRQHGLVGFVEAPHGTGCEVWRQGDREGVESREEDEEIPRGHTAHSQTSLWAFSKPARIWGRTVSGSVLCFRKFSLARDERP